MEALRDQTDADSVTEVIRNAVSVYEALIQAKQNGEEIYVRDTAGVEHAVILLP